MPRLSRAKIFCCYQTICEIEGSGAAQRAGRTGDRLTRGLQKLIRGFELPFVAFNQGSIVHLETVGTMHFAIDWSRPWRIPAVIKATSERKAEMEHLGPPIWPKGWSHWRAAASMSVRLTMKG